MKILVTGANGYLGRGIVKELLNKDQNVIATDLIIDDIDLRATRIACDIFNEKDIFRTLGEPDIVLHLAWKDGFMHYSNAHIDLLPDHYHFIQKMIEAGVKKIGVLGSMHEVGFFEGSISEKTSCNPVTPYGISKNALRELTEVLTSQKGVIFQWLRGYYIVDNTPYGASIFSKIAKAALECKKEFPFTFGQNQYDFIDYNDFCSLVSSTILQDEIVGIIDICSGRPEKLADRVERFIQDNNYNIKLQYGVFPDRPYDSKAIWGNDSKIRKIVELSNRR